METQRKRTVCDPQYYFFTEDITNEYPSIDRNLLERKFEAIKAIAILLENPNVTTNEILKELGTRNFRFISEHNRTNLIESILCDLKMENYIEINKYIRGIEEN